jgi:hypothetical protein
VAVFSLQPLFTRLVQWLQERRNYIFRFTISAARPSCDRRVTGFLRTIM